MQITTNEPFVRRRSLIGRLATIFGFVVLIAGMYVSLQQPQRPEQFWIPWLTLFIGIIALQIGKHHTMRWGTHPRVDHALAKALKGFDHRYHLYNFAPDLPAEHLLVTPQGVVVIEPRPFIGEIVHHGDRWTRPLNLKGLLQRFADGGLGNPTREALQSAAAMKALLRERLGEQLASSITVLPVIVLTNPRARLQLSEPNVPVVTLADLASAVRQLRNGRKLAADVQRQLDRALQGDLPRQVLSTTRSNER